MAEQPTERTKLLATMAAIIFTGSTEALSASAAAVKAEELLAAVEAKQTEHSRRR